MLKNYSLISAVAINDSIGDSRTNDLLWNIPSDLKRFKEKTKGHSMIMGSKTFKSLGRVLPGREHIVITRDPDSEYNAQFKRNEWVIFADCFDTALEYSEHNPTVVIGGAEIYAQALFHPTNPPSVLDITLVRTGIVGNVVFPTSVIKYPDQEFCKIGNFYYACTFESHTGSKWFEENNFDFKFIEWKLITETSTWLHRLGDPLKTDLELINGR